jgi:hypothetical protein
VKRYRVKIIPHAQIKGAPFFIKGTILGKFREEGTVWTLMDWDGAFQEAYDFAEDHCSILVFDREGVLRMQSAVEELDQEILGNLLAEIRRLVE